MRRPPDQREGHTFSPEAFGRTPPCPQFDLLQGDCCGTSDLQKCKMIGLQCFRTHSLWSFVTAAAGNEYVENRCLVSRYWGSFRFKWQSFHSPSNSAASPCGSALGEVLPDSWP